MRLTKEQREIVNEIFDEALATYDGERLVGWVEEELMAMQGGGHWWVGEYLDSCRLSGLKSRIRQRSRAGRAAVAGQSVPTCYVTGGVMTSWMQMPADELGQIVDRLTEQAETLNAHARVITLGQSLATEHGVETAWLGFEAAGVSVVVAS